MLMSAYIFRRPLVCCHRVYKIENTDTMVTFYGTVFVFRKQRDIKDLACRVRLGQTVVMQSA